MAATCALSAPDGAKAAAPITLSSNSWAAKNCSTKSARSAAKPAPNVPRKRNEPWKRPKTSREGNTLSQARKAKTKSSKDSAHQVVRHRDDRNSLIAVEQQQCSYRLRPVVVQQVVIPVAFHELRDQHCDIPIRLRDLLLNCVVHDGLDDKTIRRIEHHQLRQR